MPTVNCAAPSAATKESVRPVDKVERISTTESARPHVTRFEPFDEPRASRTDAVVRSFAPPPHRIPHRVAGTRTVHLHGGFAGFERHRFFDFPSSGAVRALVVSV